MRPTVISDSDEADTMTSSGGRDPTSFDPSCLLEHLEAQNDRLIRLMESQSVLFVRVSESLKQMQDVVTKLDSGNVPAEYDDLSRWQPIPQISATSSSAWNALLETTMLDTIVPAVQRWRGSLDTLLIFIALFSAIVTAFYVQASNSLTPDPSVRTNELLVNLVDAVVALNGVGKPTEIANQSSCSPRTNISPPASNAGAARLTFYWSVSLVLSLSLASLAVVARGYIEALVTPYGDSGIIAHKKLTSVYTQWKQCERNLGPIVGALSRLLIVSVLLFLIGVLDSLISTWFASRSALIMASVCVSVVLVALSASAITAFDIGYSCPLSRRVLRWLERPQGQKPNARDQVADLIAGNEKLTVSDCETFHSVLKTTRVDKSLEQVAATLFSLVTTECRLNEASDHMSLSRAVISESAVETFTFLLSPSSSLRSNLTAATVLLKLFAKPGVITPYSRIPALSVDARITILRSLKCSAERFSTTTPGRTHSPVLWENVFIQAMAALLPNHLFFKDVLIPSQSTILLLLSNTSIFKDPATTEIIQLHLEIVAFAFSMLDTQMKHYISKMSHSTHSSSCTPDDNTDWDTACEHAIQPWTSLLQSSSPEDAVRACTFQKATIDATLECGDVRPYTAAWALLRHITKLEGVDFLILAIRGTVKRFSAGPLPVGLSIDAVDLLQPILSVLTVPVNGDHAELPFEYESRTVSWFQHLFSGLLSLVKAIHHATNVHATPIRIKETPHDHSYATCDLFCFFASSISSVINILDYYYARHAHALSQFFGSPAEAQVAWRTLVLELQHDGHRDHGVDARDVYYGDRYYPRVDASVSTSLEHRLEVRDRILQELEPLFDVPSVPE